MLCVGGTVAHFARSLSSAGSMYTYLTRGANRWIGFLRGWCYAAAFLILGGAVLCGFGFFTATLVNLLTGASPSWVWFFLAGLVLMSLFNVRTSTRIQLAFLLISMVAMLVVSVIVIAIGSPPVSVLDHVTPVADPGRSLDLAAFWPSAAGIPWTGILFGLSFAMLSFTGAETSAVLAEETRNPPRVIPRAVVGSIVLAELFCNSTELPASRTQAVTSTPIARHGVFPLGCSRPSQAGSTR